MSFELQVEFVGVCLNVVHRDTKRVAVLIPDARNRGPYVDGRTAEPHVGYLRYDAAFVDGSIPLGDLDDPTTAIVHQLSGEVIDLGLSDDGTGIDTQQLFAPQLECTNDWPGAARDVELIPGLFSTTPPKELLARCVLTNGGFSAAPDNANWKFSAVLRKKGEKYEPTITHKVVWSRTLRNATKLTLGLSTFNGSSRRTIDLQPRTTSGNVDVIRIKIANLCSGNPLEWDPLNEPLPVDLDTDFKWVYNLLRSTTEPLKDRLGGSSLPVPHRQKGGVSVRNCPGAQINGTF